MSRPKRNKNIVKICKSQIEKQVLTKDLALALVKNNYEDNELMQDPVLLKSEYLDFPL